MPRKLEFSEFKERIRVCAEVFHSLKKVLNGIKILGDGELTVALTVKANKFSASAVEKIEAIGGKAEVI